MDAFVSSLAGYVMAGWFFVVWEMLQALSWGEVTTNSRLDFIFVVLYQVYSTSTPPSPVEDCHL